LWLSALDQQAEFRLDSALALLRLAIRADSTFFVPFDAYRTEMQVAGRHSQLRREFPELPRTASATAQCKSIVARTGFSGDFVLVRSHLPRLDGLAESSGCKAALVAAESPDAPLDVRLSRYRDVLSAEPELITARGGYASVLNLLGREADAVATFREGIRLSAHPLESLGLQLQLVAQFDHMGDSAAAGRLRAAIGASVSRDGRPYLRWRYVQELARIALRDGPGARWDSLARLQVEIARSSGAPVAEFLSTSALGAVLAFSGSRPRDAIRPLTRAVVLADSLGGPQLIRSAYLTRVQTASGF
jgi:hypothetical protein